MLKILLLRSLNRLIEFPQLWKQLPATKSHDLDGYQVTITQLTFTCSKSTIETPEKDVK